MEPLDNKRNDLQSDPFLNNMDVMLMMKQVINGLDS